MKCRMCFICAQFKKKKRQWRGEGGGNPEGSGGGGGRGGIYEGILNKGSAPQVQELPELKTVRHWESVHGRISIPPIFKKGKKKDLGDYRHVHVTFIPGKDGASNPGTNFYIKEQ